MSQLAHGIRMKPTAIRTAIQTAALLLLLICWAGVIWVALQVSTIVLASLDMIIELAGITP